MGKAAGHRAMMSVNMHDTGGNASFSTVRHCRSFSHAAKNKIAKGFFNTFLEATCRHWYARSTVPRPLKCVLAIGAASSKLFSKALQVIKRVSMSSTAAAQLNTSWLGQCGHVEG